MNNLIVPVLLVAGLPFLVTQFEKKFKLIEWLSPVVCCYILGILLGNQNFFKWDVSLARSFSEVSVMMALPMLLLATDFIGWFKLAKTTIISFLALIVCVVIVSIGAGFLFQDYDPEVWKMAGMLTGVYVGGTANLTTIGKILEIREDAFITLNAIDLALGGFYLLIIMSVGVKLLTKLLKPFNHEGEEDFEADLIGWEQRSFLKKCKNCLILIVLSGVAVGLSLFLSRILTGGESAGVIIMGLTVIALSLSFIPKIRHFEGSEVCGQYFLLIFCFSVGSMANVEELFVGKLWYFTFCTTVMFGSIFLHFICCFFLKIDRDTAIITNIAGIFGPAFVAPMGQVLKNRAILVSGVTTGLFGIAVANFVGLFVSYCLK